MATLYKRKSSDNWQIEYTDPNGKRIQRSAGTVDEAAARQYAAQLEHEAWQQARLKAKPPRPWQEAVIRWLTESSHKRSLDDDKLILRWLHPHLHGVLLNDIDRRKVEAIRQAKLEEGAKPATANRMLALLRAILNKAVNEWEWLDSAPKVTMGRVEKPTPRWLTHAEAMKLIGFLPPHLAEMARFSLVTGLRESNVTRLQWAQIDLERKHCWVNAEQAKGKRGIAVPLNADALSCIRRQIGKHETHVFTYRGEPVTRCNNHGWRTAVKKAGLDGVRWHDLRHTWASWHVQNGTPLHILQELGGWASLDMVKVYAHLSPSHLAEYANRPMPSVTMSLTAQ